MIQASIRSLAIVLAVTSMVSSGCRQAKSNAQTNQNSEREIPATQALGRVETLGANEANVSPTPTPAAQANAVCPDPAKPCKNKTIGFDDWALSFKLPAKPLANKTYRSAPFYAVLLKTYTLGDNEDCDGGEFITALEDERKTLQRENPDRKVFASYECPNMGATDYDFPGKMDAKKEREAITNFIAIYAGATKEDAESLLPKFKAKYPNAAVKPMTATAEWIVQ